MWSIFKKKKPSAKKLTEEQIEIIKSEIQTLNKKWDDETNSINERSCKRVEKENTTCPKCGSNQVVDKFRRIKGDMSGSFSGSSSLFGRSSYGSIHGQLDTLEINECGICGNEWKKDKVYYLYSSDIKKKYLNTLRWHLSEYNEAKNCTFDKNDFEEVYNSYEEKISSLLQKVENGYHKREAIKMWQGFHIETVKELVKSQSEYFQEEWQENYDEDVLLALGLIKF